MRFSQLSVLLFSIGVLSGHAYGQPQPPSEPGELETRLLYGQGFDFWSKVDGLHPTSGNTSDLLTLLESSFDHPEEGMGTFGLRYRGPVDNGLSDIVDHAYFGAGADALAGGVARNRILPRVQAYALYTGHVDFGVGQRLPADGSGWEYGLGSTLGAGQRAAVDDTAIGLMGAFAPNRSFIFYSGLDAHLGYQNRFNDSLRSRYRLSAQPTLFHSDFSGSAAQYRLEEDDFAFRWREQSEWDMTLNTGYEPLLGLGIHAVLGQQPVPLEMLPRTWDTVHRLRAWPAFGQLLGLGSRVHLYSSRADFGLYAYGGFYGGYPGCSLHLHAFGFQLAAGSYGVEQSAGYRIDGSRINFMSIGGHFAL